MPRRDLILQLALAKQHDVESLVVAPVLTTIPEKSPTESNVSLVAHNSSVPDTVESPLEQPLMPSDNCGPSGTGNIHLESIQDQYLIAKLSPEHNSSPSAKSSSSSSTTSSNSSSPSSSESMQDPISTDEDEEYIPPADNNQSSDESIEGETPSTPRKRKKGQGSKKKITKLLRDSGKEYTSLAKSRKAIAAKRMGPACDVQKCSLKCSTKINEEQRRNIFVEYWNMASLTRQRDFIAGAMQEIHPRYQYKK